MVRGEEACALTGIPTLHARAFQTVADATRCMISSRAVGKYATGLIEESYASKGFHNKAKSCNWGPMAGFVLADPRFTKAPEVKKQAEALKDAVEHHAVEVPVVISEARRRWLLKNNCIQATRARTYETHYYFASSPQGQLLLFVLKRARNVQGANGADMWSVHYARAEGRVSFRDVEKVETTRRGDDYLPVLAMRDPLCAIPAADYRSATTGDYDLFAIYAKSRSYRPGSGKDNEPRGYDQRMVGHATLEKNIKAGLKDTGEDEHLGNMTQRIRDIRDSLNIAIQRTGYAGGNMVHHSDEGGRPFVGDIDLPFFAVVPRDDYFGIESVEDFRQFIRVHLEGYAPVFNPGWMKQLVPTAGLIKARFGL